MNILETFGDGKYFLKLLLKKLHWYLLFIFPFSDRTLRGLSEELRKATEEMKKADCSITSVQSGCELFQRFISLTRDLDQSVCYYIT